LFRVRKGGRASAADAKALQQLLDDIEVLALAAGDVVVKLHEVGMHADARPIERALTRLGGG
jgi:hypothetical protein